MKRAVFLVLITMMLALTAQADVTVRYDCNGGSGPERSTVLVPDASGVISFSHPSEAPRRSGCQFLGWLCQDNPVYYPIDQPGQSIRYRLSDGQLSYTAQWMPNDHPAWAPYVTATAFGSDGTLYDVVEAQFKCVQKNEATYYCLHNWYNSSGEFSGIIDGSGYAGFQYKDGKTWTILSVWGNEHGVPAIEYAPGGSVAEPFGGEGTGMHILAEYPVQEFTWYTMRIQARTSGQKTVYEQWVKPENGSWEMICAISYPRPNLGFTWDCFFLEDWAGNNLPRSCQIRGYCARRANDGHWLNATQFSLRNHLANTGEQNVRYDCNWAVCDSETLWIQSGGDGFAAKAPSMPATAKVAARGPETASLQG